MPSRMRTRVIVGLAPDVAVADARNASRAACRASKRIRANSAEDEGERPVAGAASTRFAASLRCLTMFSPVLIRPLAASEGSNIGQCGRDYNFQIRNEFTVSYRSVVANAPTALRLREDRPD